MDAGYDLAENVVNTKFSDLPENVVEVTKKSVIDTLACALAWPP